ncbi:MAG: Uncharacterised protein [Hyphomonas sp. TMED17]|nr:MAG: Uncharacterised protein [Hyphomonas sp. TMED17]
MSRAADYLVRLAEIQDTNAICQLMAVSMQVLLPRFLTPEQVRRSADSMGLDTGLIADQTYFVVFDGNHLVGCGGWSRRRTLFGGDASANRDETLADPATEPAKIRAMYTHPDHVRQGIGRRLLDLAEQAARSEGFKAAEMGSTALGAPLYRACGYAVIEDVSVVYDDAVSVPIIRMRKML